MKHLIALLLLSTLIGSCTENPTQPNIEEEPIMSRRKSNQNKRSEILGRSYTLRRELFATASGVDWYINVYNVSGEYYVDVELDYGESSEYYNFSGGLFPAFETDATNFSSLTPQERAFNHGRMVALIMMQDKIQKP